MSSNLRGKSLGGKRLGEAQKKQQKDQTLQVKEQPENFKDSLVILEDDLGDASTFFLMGLATRITEKQVCEFVEYGDTLIYAVISSKRRVDIGLEFMSQVSDLSKSMLNQRLINATVSVEARHGVTTGISAKDRASTLRALAKCENPKQELVTPGHIFPIVAREGGTLVRATAFEAAFDFAKVSEEDPVVAITQILNTQGEIATVYDLQKLSLIEKYPVVKISQIINFRLKKDKIVEQVVKTKIPIENLGVFDAYCFVSKIDNSEHLALVKGEISNTPLVRIQSAKLISDLLDLKSVGEVISPRTKLYSALEMIAEEGSGVLVYIRHPRRGKIGEELSLLKNQETTLNSQESPVSTSLKHAPLNQRNLISEYGVGAQILRELGIKKIRLLTSKRNQIPGLDIFDIQIVEQVELK